MAKKTYIEIEWIIEDRIAELSKEYDLDKYDIADIRLQAYRENGWSRDFFPEKAWGEEEEEDTGIHYMSMEDQLHEVGMSMRDFF